MIVRDCTNQKCAHNYTEFADINTNSFRDLQNRIRFGGDLESPSACAYYSNGDNVFQCERTILSRVRDLTRFFWIAEELENECKVCTQFIYSV